MCPLSIDFLEARKNMILGQLRPNLGHIPELLEIIYRIPRELFLDDTLKVMSYHDRDLLLSEGEPRRYLLSPRKLSRLIGCMDNFKPNAKVLVVGFATGYSLAVLYEMGMKVCGVEENPLLYNFAQSALSQFFDEVYSKSNIADIISIDNVLHAKGYPDEKPFDYILIEGGVSHIPSSLFNQLSDTGKIIAFSEESPVGLCTFFKNGQSKRIAFEMAPLLSGFDTKKTQDVAADFSQDVPHKDKKTDESQSLSHEQLLRTRKKGNGQLLINQYGKQVIRKLFSFVQKREGDESSLKILHAHMVSDVIAKNTGLSSLIIATKEVEGGVEEDYVAFVPEDSIINSKKFTPKERQVLELYQRRHDSLSLLEVINDEKLSWIQERIQKEDIQKLAIFTYLTFQQEMVTKNIYVTFDKNNLFRLKIKYLEHSLDEEIHNDQESDEHIFSIPFFFHVYAEDFPGLNEPFLKSVAEIVLAWDEQGLINTLKALNDFPKKHFDACLKRFREIREVFFYDPFEPKPIKNVLNIMKELYKNNKAIQQSSFSDFFSHSI
jgi:protein-L-isoaspartate(D-aspartate) O-methyltransferase